MPTYTKVGPFTNNSSPPIDKTFLDGVENQLAAVQYGTNMLTSPYLLRNNSTLNSGSSATYTCTGVGTPTIPSGIKAVWLNIFFTPAAHGAAVEITPHGTAWSAGLYPIVGEAANGTDIVCGQILVAVDGSGQIDVAAVNANAVGLYVGICAYLY